MTVPRKRSWTHYDCKLCHNYSNDKQITKLDKSPLQHICIPKLQPFTKPITNKPKKDIAKPSNRTRIESNQRRRPIAKGHRQHHVPTSHHLVCTHDDKTTISLEASARVQNARHRRGDRRSSEAVSITI